MGGLLKAQQTHLFEHDRVTRRATAMASHRGFVEADGGDRRNESGENRGRNGEIHVIGEIPHDSTSYDAPNLENSASPSSMTPLNDRLLDPTGQTTAGSASNQGEIQSAGGHQTPIAGHTPDGTARSRKTARVSHGNVPTTQVVVHYAVPEGQRYLPITLNNAVTMIHIGRHNGDHFYEPISTWLQSPEDGLRFHRTMNADDVYNGPLDMALFGRPVAGPISSDENWLINPLSYDPTRPRRLDESTVHNGETHIVHQNLASPIGNADIFGPSRPDAATDVDIGLLAELGESITRGANDVRQHWTSGVPEHSEHTAQPVPATAPITPETMAKPVTSPQVVDAGGPALLSNQAWSAQHRSYVTHDASPSTSLAGYAAEVGTEIAVTSMAAAVDAVGGASAGELMGGDFAVGLLGPVAEPLGQYSGRNTGRIVGGALGAGAIRCATRSSTRSRSVSQVRFAP